MSERVREGNKEAQRERVRSLRQYRRASLIEWPWIGDQQQITLSVAKEIKGHIFFKMVLHWRFLQKHENKAFSEFTVFRPWNLFITLIYFQLCFFSHSWVRKTDRYTNSCLKERSKRKVQDLARKGQLILFPTGYEILSLKPLNGTSTQDPRRTFK